MAWRQDLPSDLQRSLEIVPGGRVISELLVQEPEVVEHIAEEFVPRSQLLADGGRTLQRRLGRREVPRHAFGSGQIAERLRDLDAARTEDLLPQRQDAVCESLGSFHVVVAPEHDREVGETGGVFRVLLAVDPAAELDAALGRLARSGGPLLASSPESLDR